MNTYEVRLKDGIYVEFHGGSCNVVEGILYLYKDTIATKCVGIVAKDEWTYLVIKDGITIVVGTGGGGAAAKAA